MKVLLFKLLFAVTILWLFSSCASVQPYERQYISDPEMQMNGDAGKEFSNYVYSIREGSTPSGTGKASGGCGCN